jgi:uncharacterized protein (DUF983 family)
MKEACKLCGQPTSCVYNINLKAVPICEDCGNQVFIQQAIDLGKKESDRLRKRKKKKP